MKSAPRVLLIEDEGPLRQTTVAFLNLDGCQAHGVGSLTEAEQWMLLHSFDVLLLDLGLPDGDGLEWLASKKQLLGTKGVIITSARGENSDRIVGARAGCDSYLVKPVALEELSALIGNLHRRLVTTTPSIASWRIDCATWLLYTPAGQSVKLTGSEMAVMRALARQPGVTLPRDELIMELGCKPDSYDPRRMEILVRRLRNKVSDHTDTALPLETVHRQGYVFVSAITLQPVS
ncbi:MAG: response regulator transcription factor [Pseudomonadota bacterium]